MDNHCPLCKSEAYQSIKTKPRIDDTDKIGIWLFCKCGCVFNSAHVNPGEIFRESYRAKYIDMKSGKERQEYYFYTYGNFIEELIYGRKALDVGYCLDFAIMQLRACGWLATGIDLISDDRYQTGDFIKYDFKGERFDFIKMTDFLQCVSDPLRALRTAYELLYPSGVLLVVTPDTDLIRDNFFPNWGHWDREDNFQYYNEKILRGMFNRCGSDLTGYFEIKLIHRDVSRRFPSWNNIHMIAQKISREKEAGVSIDSRQLEL